MPPTTRQVRCMYVGTVSPKCSTRAVNIVWYKQVRVLFGIFSFTLFEVTEQRIRKNSLVLTLSQHSILSPKRQRKWLTFKPVQRWYIPIIVK